METTKNRNQYRRRIHRLDRLHSPVDITSQEPFLTTILSIIYPLISSNVENTVLKFETLSLKQNTFYVSRLCFIQDFLACGWHTNKVETCCFIKHILSCVYCCYVFFNPYFLFKRLGEYLPLEQTVGFVCFISFKWWKKRPIY